MKDEVFERRTCDNPMVRRRIIDRFAASGEDEKALEMIRESLDVCCDDREMTAWCCRKMTRLCRFKDTETYRDALCDILTQYMPCDPESFMNLKGTYRESEWVTAREEILRRIEGLPGENVIYAQEGMYNRLMESLRRKCDLDEMLEYEDLLGEKYAAEIMRTYEEIFDDMLRRATRRNQYRKIVMYVKSLEKYPGGEGWICRMADKWRSEYSRKNALLMELAKL